MKRYSLIIFFVVGIVALIIYACNVGLSVAGIDLFLMIDNSLEFSNTLNPIILWIVLGLFVGLVYGTLTAWRKYRISFKLNYIFFIAFFSFITLVSFVNKPMTPRGSSFEPVEPLEPIAAVPKFAIIQQNTGLLSCPQWDCSVVLSYIQKGQRVEVLETRNEWCQVKYNNKIGFIAKGRLRLSVSNQP